MTGQIHFSGEKKRFELQGASKLVNDNGTAEESAIDPTEIG